MFEKRKERNFISVIVCLSVVLMLCSVCVFALSSTSDNSDAYTMEKFTIDGFGYEVTSIGNGAFSACTSPAHIGIPSNIDGIGTHKFEDSSRYVAMDSFNFDKSLGATPTGDSDDFDSDVIDYDELNHVSWYDGIVAAVSILTLIIVIL